MKKLLKQLVILFSLIVLTNVIIIRHFLPFGWGDPMLTPKIRHFNQNAQNFNAVFFGESMTYRQIDPKKVDAALQYNGFDFRSFNMGADAHNMLQQMREADYLISENPEIKYVFLNLSMTADLFWSNLHTAYIMHWLDFGSLKNGIKISLESTYLGNTKKRLLAVKNYLITFLEKSLLFGVIPDALFNLTADNSHYLGYDTTGYYPYSDTASQLLTINPESEALLKKMRQQYLENDSLRNEIFRITEMAYRGDLGKVEMPYFSQLMNDYIAKKEKQGIRVFYILPPKMDKYYFMLLPAFESLPEANRINLANPQFYPEFYALENTFNFRHLNVSGAGLYSEILAEEIRKFLAAKPENNDLSTSKTQ